MSKVKAPAISRRALLGELMRGAVAVAAMGATYALSARRGGRCRVPALCQDCPSIKACTLPAALRARLGENR